MKDWHADPETIQKRFGIFGDSTVMGFLIGLVMGILAGYDVAGIGQLAVKTGAVMVLMPKMVALLMEGLTPISESANSFVQKRFPGRELYIGMDAALSVGHPAVLSSSLILVPITILLAVILPGNTTLPFGDSGNYSILSLFDGSCLWWKHYSNNLRWDDLHGHHFIHHFMGGTIFNKSSTSGKL